MKKFLTSIVIILLMFNFIFYNTIYAVTEPPEKREELSESRLHNSFTQETDNTLDQQMAATGDRRH